jgi:hypothetical protein
MKSLNINLFGLIRFLYIFGLNSFVNHPSARFFLNQQILQ